MNCTCGKNAGPCEMHDTTDTMRLAFAELRKLTPAQRTRVFCWFCCSCGAETGPGQPSCTRKGC